MENLLGGSPLQVLIRLIIISVILGIGLAALGLEPFDIYDGVRRLAERIYEMGFDAVIKAFEYFVTGALIVLPIWFIARMFKVATKSKKQ